MSLPEFIDEPILVQARLLPDGGAQPTAFIWRENTYLIADWGRQWQEDAGESRGSAISSARRTWRRMSCA